jgi:phospholipid/cholesterol/gamma-HCH transport system substrate-binding protein
VTVGRVTAIALDAASFQGLVTIELEQGVQFPADTSAKILTSGLLGDQYIGLEPGGAPDMLKDGDRIMITQSALVLEQLISRFLFYSGGEQKK